MARLVKSVASKTDNFSKIDEEYAYAVWIVEKEFHVGVITDDFLAMKFWNLLDEKHGKRYKSDTNPKGKGGGKGNLNTFG